ncbi:MAG: DUF896 family protein [Streptococcaceae bacterium]|nr:DUF896 family protein [Streptococcaceae bacterium]
MDDDKIARINELAKKKKTDGLTDEEHVEHKGLQREYLDALKGNLRQHIEGIKVVNEDGEDVTPDKLKQIQKDKGIHGR